MESTLSEESPQTIYMNEDLGNDSSDFDGLERHSAAAFQRSDQSHEPHRVDAVNKSVYESDFDSIPHSAPRAPQIRPVEDGGAAGDALRDVSPFGLTLDTVNDADLALPVTDQSPFAYGGNHFDTGLIRYVLGDFPNDCPPYSMLGLTVSQDKSSWSGSIMRRVKAVLNNRPDTNYLQQIYHEDLGTASYEFHSAGRIGPQEVKSRFSLFLLLVQTTHEDISGVLERLRECLLAVRSICNALGGLTLPIYIPPLLTDAGVPWHQTLSVLIDAQLPFVVVYNHGDIPASFLAG